jgi:hypothetical protein
MPAAWRGGEAMLREFLVPLATLSFWMGLSVVCVNQLSLLYQIYRTVAARLHSERWLREQCADPHFFANMHLHTDLCIAVENDARVGALMLSLREFTQGLLMGGDQPQGWLIQRLLSWPALAGLLALLLFGPSWLVYSFRPSRRWPECRDRCYKDA